MALNQKYNHADQFNVAASDVSAPAEPGSGDAVLVGNAMPAVALTDPYTDQAGTSLITVKTNGAYDLDVEAADGAISTGDRVYINATTGALSNTDTDVAFGHALAGVDNSATATIPVKIG